MACIQRQRVKTTNSTHCCSLGRICFYFLSNVVEATVLALLVTEIVSVVSLCFNVSSSKFMILDI